MSTKAESQQPIPAPPQVSLLQLATGYMVSQAVYVAAKLGLADLITARPCRVDELAKEVGADASALRRLLRLLVTCGVFSEDARGGFPSVPGFRASPERRARIVTPRPDHVERGAVSCVGAHST